MDKAGISHEPKV